MNHSGGTKNGEREDTAEFPPEGFVDKYGACRILGITRRALSHWVSDGKVTFGTTVYSKIGGRRSIYPVNALKQLRATMLGRDTLFKGGAGTYDTPAGWVRRREACEMLGVDKTTWHTWASDGLLPKPERFDDGPEMYRVEDLKSMLYDADLLVRPYPDPDHPGAIRVPLCGGNVRPAGAREAIVDAESLALLDDALLIWECLLGGEVAFVGICRSETHRGVSLRRMIMGIDDKKHQVGHLNDNPLDCRRANLVARTIQQRTQGARKMKSVNGQPCSSQFKGVCFDKQTGKWRAGIVSNGISRKLGRFKDELAAAEAYDEAAKELFGEYARLNFPDGVDARLEQDQREDQRSVA